MPLNKETKPNLNILFPLQIGRLSENLMIIHFTLFDAPVIPSKWFTLDFIFILFITQICQPAFRITFAYNNIYFSRIRFGVKGEREREREV